MTDEEFYAALWTRSLPPYSNGHYREWVEARGGEVIDLSAATKAADSDREVK